MLLGIFSVIMLPGCAPDKQSVTIYLPKIETQGTFTFNTLREQLLLIQKEHNYYIHNIDIRDSLYARITKESAISIGKAVWASGFRYTPNAFDCEDYASLFQFVAVLSMQNHLQLQAAPAVGTIYYRLPNGSNHAINFVIVGPEDNWAIYFVEPQTGELTSFDRFDGLRTIYRIII